MPALNNGGKLAVFLSAVLLGLGCATLRKQDGIHDVVAVVKGTIDYDANKRGIAAPSCILELHSPSEAAALRTAKVQGQFLQHYGLAPDRYYFTITCEGSSTLFKTSVYKIKDMRYMRNPIDLGVVAFK